MTLRRNRKTYKVIRILKDVDIVLTNGRVTRADDAAWVLATFGILVVNRPYWVTKSSGKTWRVKDSKTESKIALFGQDLNQKDRQFKVYEAFVQLQIERGHAAAAEEPQPATHSGRDIIALANRYLRLKAFA